MATPRLWLSWAIASALGAAVVGALEGWRLQFLATLVLQGFIVGAAQAWVLRAAFSRGTTVLWSVLTGLGVLAANLLAASILQQPLAALIAALEGQFGRAGVIWLNVVSDSFVWGFAAVVQLPLLWRNARMLLWLPAALVGGALWGVASVAVAGVVSGIAATTLAYGVGGLAYGLVTGAAIDWLAAATRHGR